MDRLPEIVPPLPQERRRSRNLSIVEPYNWLRAGWEDLTIKPAASLIYGVAVFTISLALVYGMVRFNWDFVLFPALAGFLVVGPVLAVGLYEKSRRIANGHYVGLKEMIFVNAASGGQVLFAGAILSLLMLLWLRAAVLIYALFFGLQPFPGLNNFLPVLFATPTGWGLLITGTSVGGLFAAFAFAIGALSIPMLLSERIDVFTAMGKSLAIVWANLPVMLSWGAIVLTLTAVSIMTGLFGVIVTFPLLGHATWHAYEALKD